MSREDDVGKMLGTWLGKAKNIGQPPELNEAKDTLNRPETVHCWQALNQLHERGALNSRSVS